MITVALVAVAVLVLPTVLMCVVILIATARLEREAERANRKAAAIKAENAETRAIFRAQDALR